MDENLTQILEDIYTLEPDLREQDTEVRSFVSSLINANPLIKPDVKFVNELRAQLVPQKNQIGARGHSVNWWFIHLMPIGAIALLMLIMVPEIRGPFSTREAPVALEDVSLEAPSMPSAKFASEPTEETSMLMVAPEGLPPNRFIVGNQIPGTTVTIDEVTLSQPGFIVITLYHDGDAGEVIGVGELLDTGITTSVQVPLGITLKENETHAAVLYLDDGDTMFDENLDIPVTDATLNVPVVVPFDVVSTQIPDVLSE